MKLNKFVKSKTNYTTIKNTLLYTNCLALIKHLLRLLKQKRKENPEEKDYRRNRVEEESTQSASRIIMT